MDYTKRGKSIRNAETHIDYTNRIIKHNYPEKSSNYGLYAGSLFGAISLLLWGLIFVLIIEFNTLIPTSEICIYEKINVYGGFLYSCNSVIYLDTYSIILSILFFIILLSGFFVVPYLTGKIAYHIPYVHKNWATINALLKPKNKSIRYDLSSNNKKLIKIDNLVIWPDYDIVYAHYSYIGENKLLKFDTYYTGHSSQYIAIFTFEKNITEGILMLK